MKKYILALDQGTTSSRAILFSRAGEIVSTAAKDFEQIFPVPGWVEQNPMDILESQIYSFKMAVESKNIAPEDIAAIGITNQRETVIVWEKSSGKPICNAIVWQCRRTADICENLKARGLEDYIRKITGLPIDAYFSGTKIKWILDNVPSARKKAEAGELLAGTVDSWLIWNLTGGKCHITDVSNASRTMLFDINKLEYSKKLCEILEIPMSMLPKVVSTSDIYGEIDCDALGEYKGIPICSAVGDQQASLFGQCCFEAGDTKNTYGTGCFTLMNIGEKPILSESLITTIGWKIGEKTIYAAEGSVFNAGSSIKWLRDELGIINKPSECDSLAESLPDNGGVYFVSAFTGLGAPYWDMYARGTLTGLTRGTGRAHICRAVLEGIAYQVTDLVRAMEREFNCPITVIKVDGGASVSRFLMQFQSNLLSLEVKRPPVTEATAFGAALLAGLAVGFWDNIEAISKMVENKGYTVFSPEISLLEADELYSQWKTAVRRTKSDI
jgi:glycerol kinase